MSTADVAKLATTISRLQKENKQLKAINKAAYSVKADNAQFLDDLRKVVASEDKFSYTPVTVDLKAGVDKSHTEVAAVALSDIHLSETVRKDDSCGVNEFNSMICANRMWEHVQSAKSIINRHSAMYRISRLWVPILGDIVNGSIHLDHILSNDMSDPASVILGSRLLYMTLMELSSLGLPIDVDCVHGNHARMTPKMPTKRQAHTNLDWLIYEHLKDKLDPNPQFNVTVHTSQIGLRRIFKWNYVIEHGIGVSGNHEEALEDSIRALLDDPVYRKATGYSGASFDQLVIGNTHKARFLERTIVNGCFTGQNELGMSWRLKPIKASQAMWGISAKRVRTWQYNIDFTEVVSSKVENPFSEYTAWFMKKHRR